MRLRIPYFSMIAAGALTLGGCAYGDFGYGGVGYGSPYYGSGYGYGYDYGPYGGYGAYPGYYGGYGYGAGYGSPYYGWYDNYYYPGTGIYVYDSYRRPRVWSDSQRTYWQNRQSGAGAAITSHMTSPNWSGFQRVSTTSDTRRSDAQKLRSQQRETLRQQRLESRSQR